jgi:RNA methyltransferase, TrmH family
MTSPQIERITSTTNSTLKGLKRLAQDSSAYREQGRLWLEGDHLLEAALSRGRPLLLAVITDEAVQARPHWWRLAQRAPRVLVVTVDAFAALSGLDTPAQLGACVQWQCEALRPRLNSVVLDRLQDAGNVGSILRSAAALGVEQVLALKGTAHLGSPKVLRAAMGAHFALHCVEGLSAEELPKLDLPLLATSSHAGALLGQHPLPKPCAWVFGHEGQGVSEALLDACDDKLRIAQPGGEESLNVAAAAAICLYESARSL